VPTSKLYRPSDRHLLTKLVPTFVDSVCHVVSVTDPYGRILDFLDRPVIIYIYIYIYVIIMYLTLEFIVKSRDYMYFVLVCYNEIHT
jgi:hypothetical protein